MFSNAAIYDTHRSLQIRDTELFLSSVIQKMDWTQEDQDIVMDIGCGPGTSLRTMLFPAFPRVKNVIGMDIIPNMIEYAKQNCFHEKIEYHVADIENEETIEKWFGQITKVISVYCFNWLENQHEAFSKVYKLLRPGGEAALIFTLSAAFWNCYSSLIENPKWNKFLKNARTYVPESYFKKQRAPYYRSMLEEIGYKVILCQDEDKTFSFQNDVECRVTIQSISGLTNYIPDELKNEFKEDLFQDLLKYSGRDQDGRPQLHYTPIYLLIQKPNA